MFTTITQFIGKPRHAETADTRQEIKRHDPDQPGRRNEREETEDDGIFGDDSAVVSVSALEVFLKNFLKSMAEEKESKNEEAGIIKPPAPQTPRPSQPPKNSPAARAASAYGRSSITQSVSPAAPSPEAIEALLGGEDVRIIHGLLDNITKLKKKNVEYISIEKNQSFLLSLKAAVEKALKA